MTKDNESGQVCEKCPKCEAGLRQHVVEKRIPASASRGKDYYIYICGTTHELGFDIQESLGCKDRQLARLQESLDDTAHELLTAQTEIAALKASVEAKAHALLPFNQHYARRDSLKRFSDDTAIFSCRYTGTYIADLTVADFRRAAEAYSGDSKVAEARERVVDAATEWNRTYANEEDCLTSMYANVALGKAVDALLALQKARGK